MLNWRYSIKEYSANDTANFPIYIYITFGISIKFGSRHFVHFLSHNIVLKERSAFCQ